MTRRIEQVNELIYRELSEIMSREIEWPSETLVTIGRVETLPDLELAKIFFTIYPKEKEEIIFKELIRQRPYLQHLLHQRLILKPMPKLQFLIVKQEEEDIVGKVERLLDQI